MRFQPVKERGVHRIALALISPRRRAEPQHAACASETRALRS
jgi:hypothetical protein